MQSLPDGGFQATSYVNLGNPTTQYIETDTPPADSSGNIWSRTYLDGFGRTYHGLAKGPASNQNIASDTAFTPRGTVYTETQPYYPADSIQTSTFTYDDLDRPVKLAYQNSDQVQKAYGIGVSFEKSTVTDELNRNTVTQTDAYGRVVRVDKTLNGSTVSTSYSYDLLDRLLSDNGPSYIASDLAKWLKDRGIGHSRGAPFHPQTQGKIERWHQTLKNRILLENYYLPGDLEAQIAAFVAHYNHLRYHEAIANLTPADVYFGRGQTILLERERIKRQAIQNRRLMHRGAAA